MNARVWIAAAFAGVGLLALSRLAARYLHPVPGARIPDGGAYGWRVHPITGKRTFHRGVDFAVPVGTPVLAPDDATVTKVYRHALGGLSLVLDLGHDIRAGFAHLHSTALAPGDVVRRGDIVALSGASGTVTGPHLHFTLYDGSEYVDPVPYLHSA